MTVDGLPPGDTLELQPLLGNFVCTGSGGLCGQPGGALGGERETFDATLRLYLDGLPGDFDAFKRVLRLPVSEVTDSAPRAPGDPVQPVVTDVTEVVPAGWELVSIVCDDPDAGTTVSLGAAEATIDLDLGEAITCTFTNAPVPIFADGFESGDPSAWSNVIP